MVEPPNALVSLEPSDATPSPKCLMLKGMSFFLTFPQCDVPKEVALQRIKDHTFPKPLDWIVVAEEKHQDGTPHLHVCLKFTERLQTRKKDIFDFISGKHGNYASCRSTKDTVKYVTKGGVYVSWNLDVPEFLSDKKKISNEVAKSLMSGTSLLSVAQDQPGYVMLHKRKLEEFQTWYVQKTSKPSKQWSMISVDSVLSPLMSEPLRRICLWLNANLFQTRNFGQKQLYIHGTTQLGKTSLIRCLEQYCRTYYLPPNEDFYDQYEDDAYDLAVIDEFKANKSITFLNSWLDGQVFPLRKKGSQYVKRSNIPTIIISNFSPQEAYKNVSLENEKYLDTLLRRLEVVLVDTFITIPFE